MDTDHLQEAIKKQIADSGMTAEEVDSSRNFFRSAEYKDLRGHATEKAAEAIGRVTQLVDGAPRRSALTIDVCGDVIIGTLVAMSLAGAPDPVVDIALEAMIDCIRRNLANFRNERAAGKVVVDEETGAVTYAD